VPYAATSLAPDGVQVDPDLRRHPDYPARPAGLGWSPIAVGGGLPADRLRRLLRPAARPSPPSSGGGGHQAVTAVLIRLSATSVLRAAAMVGRQDVLLPSGLVPCPAAPAGGIPQRHTAIALLLGPPRRFDCRSPWGQHELGPAAGDLIALEAWHLRHHHGQACPCQLQFRMCT